jgi:hypothetical protein
LKTVIHPQMDLCYHRSSDLDNNNNLIIILYLFYNILSRGRRNKSHAFETSLSAKTKVSGLCSQSQNNSRRKRIVLSRQKPPFLSLIKRRIRFFVCHQLGRRWDVSLSDLEQNKKKKQKEEKPMRRITEEWPTLNIKLLY